VPALLLNRWFWMIALAVGLFISAAGWAKTVESHRETKAAYKALVKNYEVTQEAYNERDLELRDIQEKLTERQKVVYVSKDNCADSRIADDILVSLRDSAEDPRRFFAPDSNP
jgi:hypothetical protein